MLDGDMEALRPNDGIADRLTWLANPFRASMDIVAVPGIPVLSFNAYKSLRIVKSGPVTSIATNSL